MPISLTEIIKTTRWDTLPKETQDNLMILLERMNKVRTLWGKAMTITSGLRTKEDQIRIYRQKGVTDLSKIPMGSAHLKGAAVDIADPKRELQQWCVANVTFLESTCLWMESFEATPTWVHFQIYSPASGVRFFKP